jgi:ATP-dependent exoDNAse (exonuclease V) alpha subunit
MNSPEFYSLVKNQFPFEPTLKQDIVLQQLSDFIFDTSPNLLYVLKGYAGTGKTTIVGAIVNNLWKAKKSAVLLAPTGRAAKVMSTYSKNEAFTIHKKIYMPKQSKNGNVDFVMQINKHKKTIFIVDEASMISDLPSQSKLFGSGSLLDDLMEYVYSGHQCKLLLIGDTAQLPPVKLDLSPALNENQLALSYNKEVIKMELDEVVRQEQDSGILMNATLLRESLMSSSYDSFKFNVQGYEDIIRLVDGHDIMDAINDAYSTLGNEETAIIVRSNKRANLYNCW